MTLERQHLGTSGWIVCSGIFLVALSGRFELPILHLVVPARFVLAAPVVVFVLAWRSLLAERHRLSAMSGLQTTVLSFLGLYIFSGLWAHPLARYVESASNIALIALLCWGAGSLARWAPKATREGFLMLFVATAAVYGLGSALTGATSGIGRSIAFGGGPNVFGRVMVWGAIGAVALAAQQRRPSWLLAVPPFLLSAVMSGSRGVLVSAVLTAPVLLLAQRRSFTAKQVGAFALLVPVAVWMIWTNDRIRFLAERRFTVDGLANSEMGGRGGLWDASIDLFWEQPFVGSGIDAFYAMRSASTGFPYPHNLFLEVANDLGLMGLIVLGGILVLVVRMIVDRRDSLEPADWGIVAAIVFTLACSMFSGDIFDSRFLWVMVCVLFPAQGSTRTVREPIRTALRSSTSNELEGAPA